MKRHVIEAVAGIGMCVLLAGCAAGASSSRDVEDVRVDAVTRSHELQFLQDFQDVSTRIKAASSTDEIDELLREAELENQSRAETYWDCAERVAGRLVGQWDTRAVDGTGDQMAEYRLRLADKGSGSLEQTGHDSMMFSLEPSPVSQWLVWSVGQVTGWEADLDDVVAKHRLPPWFRPQAVGPQQCAIPFTLTVTSSQDVEWDAHLNSDEIGRITLRVGGHPFDPAPE